MTTNIDGDDLELVLLVDEGTKFILENCQFESSADGKSWVSLGDPDSGLGVLQHYNIRTN